MAGHLAFIANKLFVITKWRKEFENASTFGFCKVVEHKRVAGSAFNTHILDFVFVVGKRRCEHRELWLVSRANFGVLVLCTAFSFEYSSLSALNHP